MEQFLGQFKPDIHSGVTVAIWVVLLIALINIITGIGAIRKARTLNFFRIRRDLLIRGWQRLFFAIFLGVLALLMKSYAEPVAYRYFPPSPTPTVSATVSLTPTISLTPSITVSPTITKTPSESNTPTITPTPHIPIAVETYFEGTLTPPVKPIFSKLIFTTKGVDSLYRPIDPDTVFTNPIPKMYAVFSYDKMTDGVQWTALWYHNGELVNYETKPWDGGSGGLGFSDWQPAPEKWLAGDYAVYIFIGYEWVTGGSFTVTGAPVTSTPSRTPRPTRTATPTPTTSSTPRPTSTPTHKPTRWPTLTRTQTPIPQSPTPSKTPSPTITRWPTATKVTPSPTITRWPTATKNTP